jgi:CRISPR-associated protein Cas2
MDAARTLHLAAYDIRSRSRLQRVRRYLSAYKVGGQKSVFEIWVTDAELRRIQLDLKAMLDTRCDRLHVFALDPRMKPRLHGVAKTFAEPFFVVV